MDWQGIQTSTILTQGRVIPCFICACNVLSGIHKDEKHVSSELNLIFTFFTYEHSIPSTALR